MYIKVHITSLYYFNMGQGKYLKLLALHLTTSYVKKKNAE